MSKKGGNYYRALVARSYLFELVANKFECLVNRVGVSCDGNDAFGTGSVADIDLRSTLYKETEIIKNFSPASTKTIRFQPIRNNH